MSDKVAQIFVEKQRLLALKSLLLAVVTLPHSLSGFRQSLLSAPSISPLYSPFFLILAWEFELLNILSYIRLNWLCEDLRTIFQVKKNNNKGGLVPGFGDLYRLSQGLFISRFSAILGKRKAAGQMRSYYSNA